MQERLIYRIAFLKSFRSSFIYNLSKLNMKHCIIKTPQFQEEIEVFSRKNLHRCRFLSSNICIYTDFTIYNVKKQDFFILACSL